MGAPVWAERLGPRRVASQAAWAHAVRLSEEAGKPFEGPGGKRHCPGDTQTIAEQVGAGRLIAVAYCEMLGLQFEE